MIRRVVAEYLVSSVCLIFIVGLLLYISNKGFDFTDEGIYILFSSPFQENIFRVVNYDLIFKGLYKLFGIQFDIQASRLLRIAVNLFGSFVLYCGVKSFHEKYFKGADFGELALFVFVSGFWNYLPIAVPTLGYDALHFFGIQLFAGGLLYLTSYEKKSRTRSLFFSMLVVIGMFISWITKPPGIATMVCLTIFMFVISWKPSHLRAVILLSLVAIIFISILTLSEASVRLSPSYYSEVFQNSNDKSSSHNLGRLVFSLIKDLSLFIFSVCIGILTAKIYSRRKNTIPIILIIFLGLVFASDLYYYRIKHHDIDNFLTLYFSSRAFIAISLLYGFVLGCCIYHFKEEDIKSKGVALFFFLSLSVCYVFGSNANNLFFAIGSFQFMLLGLRFMLPERFWKVYLLSTSVFLLSMMSWAYFIKDPHRQDSIFNQKYKYVYGKGNSNSIYLNKESYTDQSEIDSVLKRYPTPYVIGYTRMLGHIYLAGKSTPGSVLWGEEDVDLYFRKRFTRPENFVLILESPNQNTFIFNYLKDYKVSKVHEFTMRNGFKRGQQTGIFYCSSLNSQPGNVSR